MLKNSPSFYVVICNDRHFQLCNEISADVKAGTDIALVMKRNLRVKTRTSSSKARADYHLTGRYIR